MNHAGKQHLWETNWSAADYSPRWMTDEAPEELKRTIVTGRFPRRGAVLDIGCGNGLIAAWLARQEFSVLGIDFSRAAIEKAKLGSGDMPNLRFQTVDVCGEPVDIGKFDGLFDRGCLHTISRELAERYAVNIANWSKPNALFLLIHKTPAQNGAPVSATQQRVGAYLANLFRPWFTLKRIRPTVIRGGKGKEKDFAMPGLAIWLVRK